MIMSEVAIKIENLRKQYRLGAIGGQTLNAELQSWWARVRGKEDPNTKIDQSVEHYGERFWALDGINLEIKKGEAVGIIGSNGAGKSTLLKILSRVTAPTEGDVWINGRIASMLEVGTGFHGELTGRENIYMNGAILGMTRKEVDAKIESIIDFSECRQFIDTPVKRYSSGMYVKLAFAVASHLDAEIMIMDEILAVGDMKFQKKCLGKMGDEAAGGKTVLYVSHNMATIRNLCTRCIVLDKGKVVFDGDVEEAISVYLDSASQVRKTFFNKDELQWPAKNVMLGKNAQIVSLDMVGKTTPIYDSTEKLVVRVKYELRNYQNDIHMAMQLYSQGQTTIGFGTVKLVEYHVGENETCFELDLSMLAEGTYCFRMNMHLLDGVNRYSESLDQTTFVYFDVTNPPDRIVWKREWWNDIRLEGFKEIGQEKKS